MTNKFRIGEVVYVSGKGKETEKKTRFHKNQRCYFDYTKSIQKDCSSGCGARLTYRFSRRAFFT